MLNVATSHLSKLLEYPQAGFLGKVILLKEDLAPILSPNSMEDLNKFIEFVQSEELGRLQEIYTATYDIHGICSMDIGFVLFGEDYKRGEFLVNVSRLCRQYNVDTKSELADHLPNFLNLMAAMTDDEEQLDELLHKILVPALDIMSGKFTYGSHNGYGLTLKILKDSINQYKKQDIKTTGVFPC